MKKLVLVAVLILGFSVMAMAQDIPATEIFAGYSHFRCDKDAACDLNGWDVAVAFNINKHVAPVVDIHGQYGKQYDPRFFMRDRNFSAHSVMFGPKFMMPVGRFTPFGQFLVGVYHSNLGGMQTRKTENNPAIAIGGGVDVNVNSRLSVRAVQAEYYGIRYLGSVHNDLRISAGAIFKFGKRY